MSAVICDYCQHPAVLVDGLSIYPFRPDLAKKNFWRCFPCSAFVGCHDNGDGKTPLGMLANAELRKSKTMDAELLQNALDGLEDCARLLGKTQAIKVYGYYTKADSMFAISMRKSIAKHREVILRRVI